MTTSSKAAATMIDIPAEPDRARMRRETAARLRSAMVDNGVDALILLNNDTAVLHGDWIEALLVKEPSQRTQNAQEAWDEFEEILNEEDETGPPAPPDAARAS